MGRKFVHRIGPRQVRGHFQTTFADLKVIMTLGGGVWGCDIIIDHKG